MPGIEPATGVAECVATPQHVPDTGSDPGKPVEGETPEHSKFWDAVCSRNYETFGTGSNHDDGVQACESIALPFAGSGSFDGSHGTFGSYSRSNSAVPVLWDSANSTDFLRATSHTIWSTQADNSQLSTSPNQSSWHSQNRQLFDSQLTNRESFHNILDSFSGDSSSSRHIDLPSASMHHGLQGIILPQHSAPAGPAAGLLQHARGVSAGSYSAVPPNSGLPGGSMPAASPVSTLGPVSSGASSNFTRWCIDEQPHMSSSADTAPTWHAASARRGNSIISAPRMLRKSTSQSHCSDAPMVVTSDGCSQGNFNLHTALCYGGSSHRGFTANSSLPSVHVQQQWPAQTQQQLPPHSPGSLASLLPGSPLRSNPLVQGFPPMPCSVRRQYNTQLQHSSDVQRQLLQQQQPTPEGSLAGPRRAVSFDSGAGKLHTLHVGSTCNQQEPNEHQGRTLGPSLNSRFVRSSSELGRSCSIGGMPPPGLLCQPAGLRRHVSTGGLGDIGTSKQPSLPVCYTNGVVQQSHHSGQASSPKNSSFSGSGAQTIGSRASARGPPTSKTAGSFGIQRQRSLSAYSNSSGFEQDHVNWVGNGEADGIALPEHSNHLSSDHRRVQSADFGRLLLLKRGPNRSSQSFNGGSHQYFPQQQSGSNSLYVRNQGLGGNAYHSGLNSNGSMNGGRAPPDNNSFGPAAYDRSPSDGASPQVLSRSTSVAGLATRICGSPMVRDKATPTSISNRQLWAQVTSMPTGDGNPGFGKETTVEDLLRVLRHLSPEASVVTAVERGLEHLDSRALAALLKELAKAGLPGRASELFEWLRSRPNDHVLAGLCDVYTYTTIIAQCGTGAGLQSALMLAAEMKERGIMMNCHAYSALMNVCIKAGDLTLALEVFDDMKLKNCNPNLVTYNILIDIYGKTGQWQKAKDVLDRLKHQNIAAEVRTYNTIIGACARAGQPEAAASVYERMLQDHAVPTATTATALVSAFAKSDQVDKAVEILQDMSAHGAERSPVAYGALVAAAERCGRPQQALTLFHDMIHNNLKPSAATFAAALSACASCGQWKTAIDIFEMMRTRGCKPDAHSHGSLMSALASGGQWQGCLSAFLRMQTVGLQAEASHLGAVIAALWSGGTAPCQAAALATHHSAWVSGEITIQHVGKDVEEADGGAASECAVKVTMAHPGGACAATVHWLLLEGAFSPASEACGDSASGGTCDAASGDAVSSRSSDTATQHSSPSVASIQEHTAPERAQTETPLASSPTDGKPKENTGRTAGAPRQDALEGNVDHSATPSVTGSSSSVAVGVQETQGRTPDATLLLLLRQKGDFSEAEAETVQAILTRLQSQLSAMSAPLTASTHPSGIRLHANRAAVKGWISSPASEGARALAAAAERLVWPPDAALADSQASQDADCQNTLATIRNFEDQDCVNPAPFTHPGADLERRNLLVTMREIVRQLQLPREVCADALHLSDRAACASKMEGAGMKARGPYAALCSGHVAGAADLAVAAVSIAADNVGFQMDLLQAVAAAGIGREAAASVQFTLKRLLLVLSNCTAGKVAMSAPRVQSIFMARLGTPTNQVGGLASWTGGSAVDALTESLSDHRLLAYSATTVAAASLIIGSAPAAAASDWPPSLRMFLCPQADSGDGLAACCDVMREAYDVSHNLDDLVGEQHAGPTLPDIITAVGSPRASPPPSAVGATLTDGSSDGPDLDDLREQLAASDLH